jgi:hypothetical protein
LFNGEFDHTESHNNGIKKVETVLCVIFESKTQEFDHHFSNECPCKELTKDVVNFLFFWRHVVTIKSENDCVCNNQQSNCVVEGSMRTDSVEAHEESVFLGEIRDFLLFF